MTHDEIEIIGKDVKDMYGTYMGKVVGTMTDIDGSVQTVGIDCGSQGLQQIQYDQLVVQGDVVIFIPKWRLDSQRLIREKQLTLRRLKALIDIISDNDEMKEDAGIVHDKYKTRMAELEEAESGIKEQLNARLAELEEQKRSVRMLLFDAKVQAKSDEITQDTFAVVKSGTSSIIERIEHETSEISSVKTRIMDLDLSMQETILPPPQNIQESAVSYLEESTSSRQQAVQVTLPEAPTEPVAAILPEPIMHDGQEDKEMEAVVADAATTTTPAEAQGVTADDVVGTSLPEERTEINAAAAFPEPPQEVTVQQSPLPATDASDGTADPKDDTNLTKTTTETEPSHQSSGTYRKNNNSDGNNNNNSGSDWLARMQAQ